MMLLAVAIRPSSVRADRDFDQFMLLQSSLRPRGKGRTLALRGHGVSITRSAYPVREGRLNGCIALTAVEF